MAQSYTGSSDSNAFNSPLGVESGSLLSSTGSAGGNSLSNLAGLGGGLAAVGVGAYDLLQGNQPLPAEGDLQTQANYEGQLGRSETTAGTGLQSYLEQGTLPPAQQAQLQLEQQAAKAQLIQGAGSRGQNTNPLKNSGLTQDLNSLGLQSEVVQGQLEQQLFNSGQQLITSGQQAFGIQAQDLTTLAQIQEKQQQDTTNAIMGFAKALGGLNWSQIGSSLSSIGSSIGSAAAAGDAGAVVADAAPLALAA